MAVKIHEPEAMDPATVSTLSRGTYTPEDIEQMEKQILNALKWRVNPPTSVSFVRQMLMVLGDESLTLKQRSTVSQIATMQLELAVADYDLISVKPSTIAYSSIVNALESLHDLDDKTVSYMSYILAKAIEIDGDDADIQELSDYLFAAVVQREPAMLRVHPHHQQSLKPTSPRSVQRRASLEESPRTTATNIVC